MHAPMRQHSSVPETARVEYKWIEDVEPLEAYEPGGLHPITVDKVLRDRYLIVDKLGHGGYATIWLAQDQRLSRYVALKIGRSDKNTVRREVVALRSLMEASNSSQQWTLAWANCDLVPKVLDEFELTGPNGQHNCYASVPMQGDLKVSSYSRVFHVPIARALAAKLTLAVAFTHAHGICHGDIHLSNVLVGFDQPIDHLPLDAYRDKFGEPDTVPVERKDGLPLTTNVPPVATLPLWIQKEAKDFTLDDARRLMLSDFGEAFNPATEPRLGKESRTPWARRAPEAFFEPERALSYPSDIWSLGTSIWDILGMKFIFPSEFVTRDRIIAAQIEVLGWDGLPPAWQDIWNRPQTADEDEDEDEFPLPRAAPETPEPHPPLEQAFEKFVQEYRRKSNKFGIFGADETAAILTLMRGMLNFDPRKRMTMEEVLQSEWMLKWAMPELRKAMDGSSEDISQLIWPPFNTRPT